MLQTEEPQILGAKVQNLVARVTWRPGFVHPWHRVPAELNSRLLRSGDNLMTVKFLDSCLTDCFMAPVNYQGKSSEGSND